MFCGENLETLINNIKFPNKNKCRIMVSDDLWSDPVGLSRFWKIWFSVCLERSRSYGGPCALVLTNVWAPNESAESFRVRIDLNRIYIFSRICVRQDVRESFVFCVCSPSHRKGAHIYCGSLATKRIPLSAAAHMQLRRK